MVEAARMELRRNSGSEMGLYSPLMRRCRSFPLQQGNETTDRRKADSERIASKRGCWAKSASCSNLPFQQGAAVKDLDFECLTPRHPQPWMRRPLAEPSTRLLQKTYGGGRGIRTPVTRKGKAVFKTACFNHSHIPPHAARTAALLRQASRRRSTHRALPKG